MGRLIIDSSLLTYDMKDIIINLENGIKKDLGVYKCNVLSLHF